MGSNLKNAPACLWMQAGVVKQKYCSTDFQCPTCRYDKALRKVCQSNKNQASRVLEHSHALDPEKTIVSKKQSLMFWKDKLRMQPLSKRPCIHHMKGHIDFKTCPKSYHCIDCEFDQYFNDQFKVYTVIEPVAYSDISGVSLPVGYYLHKGHTWLKIEDKNHVRIGMDDFASRLLGTPDHIESLLMGKPAQRGHTVFSVFREGNKAGFPSPVSGVVTQVNANLRDHSGLINKEPYTDGWDLTLYCPDLRKDLKHLMFMDTAKSFMNNEVENLYEFLEQETGLMAADGGSLGSDLYGNLPDLSWNQLLRRFICQVP